MKPCTDYFPGGTPFFENKLKHAIFVAPDLVLTGLNRILRHHAEF